MAIERLTSPICLDSVRIAAADFVTSDPYVQATNNDFALRASRGTLGWTWRHRFAASQHAPPVKQLAAVVASYSDD